MMVFLMNWIFGYVIECVVYLVYVLFEFEFKVVGINGCCDCWKCG